MYLHKSNLRNGLRWSGPVVLFVFILTVEPVAHLPRTSVAAQKDESVQFVDLSLLISPDYPCTWPTFPPFQINHYRRIGPRSAYNSDILTLDGNTGTQLDVPPHSVTPSNSGLPNAGPFGRAYTDKIAPWQFVGEACVIDCKDLLDTTPNGRSDLVKKSASWPGRRNTVHWAWEMWSCSTAATATSITSHFPRGVVLPQTQSPVKRRRGPIPIRIAWSISRVER